MGDEGLSAGAVARRLGVAVTTLRTWHQRYGLGPSAHLPGQHRRYTGWPSRPWPADILVPDSLAEALRLTLAAVSERTVTAREQCG